MSQHHTITALVQNEAGTINRLVSMFRRRGISLASFNAGDCEQDGYSRLTMVVDGDETLLHQTVRQLEKLIDVVEVEDLSQEHSLSRELALIRVDCEESQRTPVYNLVNEFYAKTPRSTPQSLFVEFAGATPEVERLLTALEPYSIGEIVRTGVVAMGTESNL
ncbi:MAG: acetolactate synthase small subunit [Chlorobia bacterium]|nr:acetolactate synthase small subunit [Fimbriimonadaceae bacterium]